MPTQAPIQVRACLHLASTATPRIQTVSSTLLDGLYTWCAQTALYSHYQRAESVCGVISVVRAAVGSASAVTASASTASAAAEGAVTAPYKLSIGGITDPGVHGKQNQDDFFAEALPGDGNAIIGVFDGHGRELGQLAAKTAKLFVRDELKKPEVLAAVEASPQATLESIFAAAHRAIMEVRLLSLPILPDRCRCGRDCLARSLVCGIRLQKCLFADRSRDSDAQPTLAFLGGPRQCPICRPLLCTIVTLAGL